MLLYIYLYFSDGIFPVSDFDKEVKPYFAPVGKFLVTTGCEIAKIWDFSGKNTEEFEDRPESSMVPGMKFISNLLKKKKSAAN